MTKENSQEAMLPTDNIFATFGFPPDEAEELLAQTDRRIGEEIALKQNLAGAVTSWMAERQLTHESAASQLGVDLSVISKVVRQHLNEFSIGDLFSMAFRTGKRFAIALH